MFEAQHESDYWKELVVGTGAKRVIAIHWDDFMTVGAGEPMVPSTRILGDFDHMMAFLTSNAEKDGVEVRLPPDWQPMDVWAGLN
jgi:hypothetical protein